MPYRTTHAYTFDDQNESRANLAEQALAVATDRNYETDPADVYLDVADLIGNLMHFCQRAGLEWEDVLGHGERGFAGDSEDGPETKRDTDRFPA